MNGFELDYNDQSKIIRFDYEGKTNEKQKKYFETLFDNELRYRGLYDEYSYFGAFRCGKSFSQQLAPYLLALSYPSLKVLYIKDTYDQLADAVIKQFNDEFEYLGAYDYKKSSRDAEFKNGSKISFRAFETDTGILSTEYDVICVCQAEDIPFELFLQLIGRASGRILGDKGIILTEGNPASGWAKDRYKTPTKELLESKRIFFLEGETRDNPHITEAYIQSLIDNYPKFWLDRYLYGLWDNREELIYSEFNENEHVIDIIDPKTINPNFKKRNGFDWGWINPSCNLWGYVDYDGILTIYDEFYQNRTLPQDIVRECNKHGRIITIADHAMKGQKMPVKDHEDRTIWTELEVTRKDMEGKEVKGMILSPCNKEELSNIILANTLFKTRKVRICRNCVNLLREIRNWKWKQLKLGSSKDMPEEPVDKDNHACDAFNYLVAELFDRVSINESAVEASKHTVAYLNTTSNKGMNRAILKNS